MGFQINLGRTPSEGGGPTLWSVTPAGKNRAKALGGEGFGGGTDEIRVLEALEEEPSTAQEIADRTHISSGRVRRELNRLAHMGCVRQGQGGGE